MLGELALPALQFGALLLHLKLCKFFFESRDRDRLSRKQLL